MKKPTSSQLTANSRLMPTYTYKTIIRDYSQNEDGNAPLMLQVFINGKRWRTPIGVYVAPKHFDKKTGLIKKSHPDSSSINLVIRKALSKANDIMVNYRLSDKAMNIESFKYEFLRGDAKHDFINIFRQHLERRKKLLEPITYRCHAAILNKLKGFRSSINMHDLTPALLDEMKIYLQRQRGNNAYTIWAFFKTIKTYVMLAKRDGLIFENPFINYKMSQPKSAREFLEEDDVRMLYNYFNHKNCDQSHRTILRYFLFSCLTGLRISDIKGITHHNLIDGELHFIMKKNRNKNKIVRLPMTAEALSLINTSEGNIFETISEQKTNQHLKEIAEKCGIKKRITYHVSRHTFGYLAIKRGINPVVVKDLMAHGKIETTMIYVHLNNDLKRESIARMNNLLTSASG